MASCSGCKKRTTSFCYVHKASICDDCSTLKSNPDSKPLPPSVASLACDSICSIGNYFDWLADGDYTWPPRCNVCNKTLQNDPSSLIRLVCKDIFHKACLADQLTRAVATAGGGDKTAAWKQVKCPTCSALLVDTTTQARTKLREQVQEFVSQLSKGESFSSPSPTAAASASASSIATPSKSSTTSSNSSSVAPSSASKRKEKEDDDFVIVNSTNNLRKTEISPAVRDLMNKAASAKAAAPAGTAPSAVSLAIPPTPSPTLDAQTRSPLVSVASSSVGAVSRPTTHASLSAAASNVSSSYSNSSSSSTDLESQRLADDDDNSKTKKPSRFMSIRNASKGGYRCSPQRIILIIMLLAVLLSVGFYIKSFAIMASNPPRASAAPQVNAD